MTVSRAKGAKARADRLFSQLVRSRGLCERCGVRDDVVTAHIIGRRFSKTRTDERNAWALDPTCHYVVDNFPDEKMGLVEDTIGMGVYDELRAKAESISTKMDWDAEVVRLSALHKAMVA